MAPNHGQPIQRVAIITGAATGLGKAYAFALADQGVSVVLNDLPDRIDSETAWSQSLESTVDSIKASGGNALGIAGDVSCFADMQKLAQAATKEFGRIDILINNAGIVDPASFGRTTPERMKRLIDVHLGGSINCTKAIWEPMRQQGYGRILMISSPAGLYGLAGNAGYAAAKAGVIGLMQTLKIEGASKNIRVNTLAPIAYTQMTADSPITDEEKRMAAPSAVAPTALDLVGEDAPSGKIVSSGMGFVAEHQMMHGPLSHAPPIGSRPTTNKNRFETCFDGQQMIANAFKASRSLSGKAK